MLGGGGCLRIRESFGFEENSIRFEDPPNNDSALLKSLVFERPPRGITVLVSSSMDEGFIIYRNLDHGTKETPQSKKGLCLLQEEAGQRYQAHLFLSAMPSRLQLGHSGPSVV